MLRHIRKMFVEKYLIGCDIDRLRLRIVTV